MNINQSKKGEVTSLLTIVSMVMIGLGLFIGTQLARQTSPIQQDPFAQSNPSQNQKILADKPSIQTPQVCFPLGSTQPYAINDPLCTGHLFPQQLDFSIVKDANGNIVGDRFRGIPNASSRNENLRNNIYVHETSKKTALVKMTGSTCLNSSTKPSNLNLNNTEIFLSPLYVREWYYPQSQTQENANEDINDVLNTLIQSDKTAPTAASIRPLIQGSNYCEYIAIRENDSYRLNYQNEKNPLIFELNPAKQQIREKLKIALNSGKFDRNRCGLYIHLRSDKVAGNGSDVYNLGYVSLKDIFFLTDVIDNQTGQTLKDICEPVTPSPSPSVLPSPSPTIEISLTPSVTPPDSPTPSPKEVACYDDCSANENLIQCGNDPTSTQPIKMKCYSIARTRIGQPFPTAIDTDSNDAEQIRNMKVDGPCRANSAECKCLPARCEDPAINCSSQEAACNIPSVTTVQQSPTPEPQVCRVQALAFVNECTQYRFETGRNNTDRLICTRIAPFDLNQIKNNLKNTSGNFQYGMTNNKQSGNASRPLESIPVDRPRIPGVYPLTAIDEPYASIRNYIDNDAYRLHRGEFTGGVLTGRFWENSITLNPGQSLDDRSITINPYPDRVSYPNEAYSNGDPASVRLFLDRNQYRVLPKESYVEINAQLFNNWSNSLPGPQEGRILGSGFGVQGPASVNSIAPFNPRYSSCINTNNASNINECDINNDNRPDNEIGNLPMKCGEDIIYGWTIMKCNQDVDYVLAIDVSTSMNERNPAGVSKLQELKETLTTFINTTKASNSNSRVSIVAFNKNASTLLNFTQDMDAALRAIQAIQETPKGQNLEGTCIDCALRMTHNVIVSRTETTRSPLVVFLSDGIPTYEAGSDSDPFNGTKACGDYHNCLPNITNWSNNIKNITNVKPIVASIGYGRVAEAGQSGFEYQLDEVIGIIGSAFWRFSTISGERSGITLRPISEIYQTIADRVNSCGRALLAYTDSLKSKDINGDGIINSIDYFLVIDSYFNEGANLKEDINGDKIVNAMDLSEVLRDFGTVIPTSESSN